MYVLVPDDPVFFAKFQSLEELLLRCLYQLHLEGPDSDDVRVVADAYESWVGVLLKLPVWPRWQADDATATEGPRTEYRLYGSRGVQLTSLYPVNLASTDLGQLLLCLRGFLMVGAGGREAEAGLVQVFRRVVAALLLPCPKELLQTLRRVCEGAPVVTLGLREEAQYRRHCATMVRILSSGDQFAYQNHLAMYQ